jgi:hypothetical protein
MERVSVLAGHLQPRKEFCGNLTFQYIAQEDVPIDKFKYILPIQTRWNVSLMAGTPAIVIKLIDKHF